jgi:hypothetical protein
MDFYFNSFTLNKIYDYCIKNFDNNEINLLYNFNSYKNIISNKIKMFFNFENNINIISVLKIIFIIIICSIIFNIAYKIINYVLNMLSFIKNIITFIFKSIFKIFNIFNFAKKNINSNEFIEIKYYDINNLKKIKIINDNTIMKKIQNNSTEIINEYIIIDTHIINNIINDNLIYYSVKIKHISHEHKKLK